MLSFLGTGLLGANFTRALLKKGLKVQVWNRSKDKATALEQYGAKAFDQAADAVRGCERVHVTLMDDQSVDEVLEQAAPGFSAGTIIVDHTTTSAAGAKKRAQFWKTKKVHYIHAPVFMGPPNALESTGIMLVSGDQEIVKKIEPALSEMTGKLVNYGPEPDQAAAFKLLGNLFHLCMTGCVADLLTLANTYGIGNDEIKNLLEMMNPGVVLQGRLRKITSNTFDEASWELSMARKDARLMVEQADQGPQPLVVIPAIAKKMDVWLEKGHAKNDWTVFSQDPSAAVPGTNGK